MKGVFIIGYIIGIVIGAVLTLAGSLLSSSREGLVEESLYTRRLGTCIGVEGILIAILSGICMERGTPIPLLIVAPVSVIVCGVCLYFIHKNKPT